MKKLWSGILIWALFLIISSAFLFFHLRNPFYADDYWPLAFARLTENPYLGVWKPFYGETFWRPLPILMDILSEKMFGLNPLGFHLLDLGLSSLNLTLLSYLTYLLVRDHQETGPKIYSIFAGLFFALHPISLLTTAWISCRADLLSGFFSLLTLILLVKSLDSQRLKWLFLGGACGLSFLAYLSKETALILPGLAIMVYLFQPQPGSIFKWLKGLFMVLFLFLIVLALYLWLRFQQLSGFGGYEPLELTKGFILPRLSYHLPRVLSRAFRDYLFWHLSPKNFWFWLLFSSELGLGTLALISLFRKPRLILLGICWTLLSLLPLWNLSQMLFYGEARLLYFSLAGVALILAGTLSQLSGRFLRSAGFIFFSLLIISLGRTSFSELKDFKSHCAKYEEVRELTLSALGTEKTANYPRRIYIMGLDFDLYYLDPMFKVYLPDWLDRMIVPGDQPSLAWLNKEVVLSYEERESFLPELELHFSDQNTALVGVKPPLDLPLAISQDQQSMILRWSQGEMKNITNEVIHLVQDRRFMQESYKRKLKFFPSWEFRKRNYPLDWKLSPGIKLEVPIYLGELYTFHALTNDPYLISPPLNFLALATKHLEFQMRIQKKDYLAPQEREGCLFWSVEKEATWQDHHRICFPIQADGKFHTYQLRLDHNLYWLNSGKITRIRLDPISFPGWFQIDSLSFSPTASQND